MIPPPPRSTLFPYTTLFRSISRHRLEGVGKSMAVIQDGTQSGFFAFVLFDDIRLETATVSDDMARRLRDRKSTRLNSSHSSISYAVFCLKKKKNIKNTLREI